MAPRLTEEVSLYLHILLVYPFWVLQFDPTETPVLASQTMAANLFALLTFVSAD
jgi:hypothetical protein